MTERILRGQRGLIRGQRKRAWREQIEKRQEKTETVETDRCREEDKGDGQETER